MRAKAVANPDDFGKLAKEYSEDAPSASAERPNSTDPQARQLPRDRTGRLSASRMARFRR